MQGTECICLSVGYSANDTTQLVSQQFSFRKERRIEDNCRSEKIAMAVLSSVRWAFRPLVDPTCDQRILKYFINLICFGFLIMFGGLANYIAENSYNFLNIPEPLNSAAIWTLTLIKLICLIHHKQHIRDIFGMLQGIADRIKLVSRQEKLTQLTWVDLQKRRRHPRSFTKALKRWQKRLSREREVSF